MGQQEEQQRKQIIFGDIFDDDDEDEVNGRTTFVADPARSSCRRRFLNEESSNGQRKYLAFSLNYSSNCDYNNR